LFVVETQIGLAGITLENGDLVQAMLGTGQSQNSGQALTRLFHRGVAHQHHRRKAPFEGLRQHPATHNTGAAGDKN
jgi:hypothetical protein